MAGQEVALANRVVPMDTAARLCGIQPGRAKTYCPFGEFSHPDGGKEPAFRVYARDAWCFACSEFYTPVKLYAAVHDVPPEEAANRLLAAVGHTPVSYAEHWRQVARPPVPDHGALAQALRNYCQGADSAWPERQLDPVVAEYLALCLGFLVKVSDEEGARLWLAKAKLVMSAALRR